MRKHYYVVNGIQPWSKADEAKLDKLVKKGFIGNVVERLVQQGYVLDENQMALFGPDGRKVCRMCSAL